MGELVGDAASLESLKRMQLDESLYSLAPNELEFYKSITGITDESELKQHIINIQTEAFHIFPYPCIRRFMFTKLKVSRYPVYAHVLEYGRTHAGAIFLEMACCFGNDARKAALDGYPVENIVATDLRRDFWDLGFKLFKDTPSTFPVPFLGGDIMSPDLLDLNASKPSARPDLSGLTSLTDLLGHVSFIHASAFFHLFSEEDQRKIAQRCQALLSTQPGSTIFGSHVGAPGPGIYSNIGGANRKMFCHSPQSWERLWQGLYGETAIQVVATLEAKGLGDNSLLVAPGPDSGDRRAMIWSVTVL
ncbi:hypothetical protein BDV93DRAFT_525383 [Ceratobasidium sp. AG-I]|nr:hypothetical protein BDV93DRAFT_525383 [Ceratobasidium sp. AG-I]